MSRREEDLPRPVRRSVEDAPRRGQRDRNTTLRQGLEGIAIVAGMALGAAVVGWLLAVVVSWVY